MAGEGDALKALLEGHLRILVRFAQGMLAQRRVTVGFVEQRKLQSGELKFQTAGGGGKG